MEWIALPHSKREAITAGASEYFTGKPCKHGHISPRILYRNRCCLCLEIYRDSQKNNGGFVSRNDPHRFGKIPAALAYARGESQYFPNITCKKGHISGRSTHPLLKSRCCMCSKEMGSRQAKKDRKISPFKAAIRNVRRGSLRKGVAFNLTAEWAEKRWTGLCEVTGLPMNKGKDNRNGPRFDSPSIDRIDPKKGYLQDNCRFVLFCINAFKGTGTDEAMLAVAKILVEKFSI